MGGSAYSKVNASFPGQLGFRILYRYVEWRPGGPMGAEWRVAEASPASHHRTNPAVMFGLGAPQELCPGELTGVPPSSSSSSLWEERG